MKSIKKIVVLGLLLGCWLLVIPPHVAAQGIDVDPLSWDFGEVGLGEELTAIITITSTEPTPLTVNSLTIVDDLTSSFDFLTDPTPPSITLTQGASLDVTVGFRPSSLGSHTASIRILSDAEPPDNDFLVPLSGTGVGPVAPVPEPATVLLLGTGLVGLVGFRKKFKK